MPRLLFEVWLEEYEVHGWRFFFKTTQYSFFTAHGPPYYQERMAISVFSLNRITQWINSALYDKGTNLIRHVFVIKTYDKLKF